MAKTKKTTKRNIQKGKAVSKTEPSIESKTNDSSTGSQESTKVEDGVQMNPVKMLWNSQLTLTIISRFKTMKARLIPYAHKVSNAFDRIVSPLRNAISRVSIRTYSYVATSLILFFGGVFLVNSIWASRPGDLLFFPKIILETRTGNSDPQIEAYDIIVDRLMAVEYLASNQRCNQLVVAEAELIDRLRDAFSAHYLDSLDWESAQYLIEMFSRIEDKSNCSLRVPYRGIGLYLEIEDATPQYLESKKSDLSARLVQANQLYTQASDLSQAEVSQMGELLLLAQSEIGQQDVSIIGLFQVQNSLFSVSQIIDKQENLDMGWDRPAFGLCLLATDVEICSSEELISRLNSIQFGSNSHAQKLELGKQNYIDYLMQITDPIIVEDQSDLILEE